MGGVSDRNTIGEIEKLERFSNGNKDLSQLEKLIEARKTGFQPFRMMGIAKNETTHSRILAWLLNPKGDHGLGDGFLREFIHETVDAAQLPTPRSDDLVDVINASWDHAQIKREWEHKIDEQAGRLDILVLNGQAKFVCAIENKIRSGEHSGQLTRYRRALEAEYPNFLRHHVFLSPTGSQPEREEERTHWVPVSYKTVHDLIGRLLDKDGGVIDPDVLGFLRHYATLLRREIMPEPEEVRALARKIYREHRDAIALINRHGPDYSAEKDAAMALFKDVIKSQVNWHIELEQESLIRFRTGDWRESEGFARDSGWTGVPYPCLFGFDLRQKDCAFFSLMMTSGGPEPVKKRLFESTRGAPFNRPPTTGYHPDRYITLHRSEDILEAADFFDWNAETVRCKIEDWVQEFSNTALTAMNETIMRCLSEGTPEV